MNPTPHPSRSGFTLIELLVVMTIISVLLVIGTNAIRSIGSGGTSTGVAQAEALFSEARAIAMGGNRPARVLIDMIDDESESYLRRLVIAVQSVDEDGLPIPGQWELAGGVLQMPSSVYFSRQFSRKDHLAGSGSIDQMDLTGVSDTFAGTYAYYEFNGEGICSSGVGADGSYTAPSFVLGRGVRDPGGEPRTTSDGRRDFGGFVIWRNGSTSVFRDPSQILGASDPTTF